MPIAAIVIATDRAAWAESAMALLPWSSDQALIEYHIEQLQLTGVRNIEVVLGDDAERVIPLVAADNVEPIVNATWRDDPASSLRAGAASVVRGTTSAIVIDVSQPRPAPVLRALCNAHDQVQEEITVPTFEGRRGAPIVVGKQALEALRNVRREADTSPVIRRFAGSTQEVRFDSDVVLLRIDSHHAYERAKSLCGAM